MVRGQLLDQEQLQLLVNPQLPHVTTVKVIIPKDQDGMTNVHQLRNPATYVVNLDILQNPFILIINKKVTT